MKRIVVNADDFGIARGVDRGILEAVAAGSVTSTSCIVPWASSIPEQIHNKVGIHLRLTDGAPVLDPREVPSLVTKDGKFPARRTDLNRDMKEVEKEWRAQIGVLIESGVEPTHFDTHHHSHELPGIRDVYAGLLEEFDVAGVPLDAETVRKFRHRGIRCADRTLLDFPWTIFDQRELPDTVHLMCHPGYPDAELEKRSTYLSGRERELCTILDPAWKEELRARGVELIGMADL